MDFALNTWYYKQVTNSVFGDTGGLPQGRQISKQTTSNDLREGKIGDSSWNSDIPDWASQDKGPGVGSFQAVQGQATATQVLSSTGSTVKIEDITILVSSVNTDVCTVIDGSLVVNLTKLNRNVNINGVVQIRIEDFWFPQYFQPGTADPFNATMSPLYSGKVYMDISEIPWVNSTRVKADKKYTFELNVDQFNGAAAHLRPTSGVVSFSTALDSMGTATIRFYTQDTLQLLPVPNPVIKRCTVTTALIDQITYPIFDLNTDEPVADTLKVALYNGDTGEFWAYTTLEVDTRRSARRVYIAKYFRQVPGPLVTAAPLKDPKYFDWDRFRRAIPVPLEIHLMDSRISLQMRISTIATVSGIVANPVRI